MSLSANAEESDANQSKFYRIVSTEPVTDADALFDTLSRFLMKDKKRQISTEYLDEKDQISSRLTWNNLRNVANSVLDEDRSRRDPVPAWIDQKEAILVDDDDDDESPHKNTSETDVHTKEEYVETSQQTTATSDTIAESNVESAQNETKEEKRAAKKAKKEGKEARKRERAEKREAKKARKEARETKKLKKEAIKRKREEVGDE